MKKTVKLSDSITTPDELSMNGNSVKTGFDTKVVIKSFNSRVDGECIEVKHNKTVLPGRVQLLENVFPIQPNMNQHIFLNDNVTGVYNPSTLDMSGNDFGTVYKVGDNIPSSILPRNNPELFKRRKVQYWCAGNGAMNKTMFNNSYPAQIINTKLYNMIPFRYVPIDKPLADQVARQYKFKVTFTEAGMIGYYFKRINFASLDGINMTVDGEPYELNGDNGTKAKWGDTQPNIEAIESNASFKGNKIQSNYIDMELNVASTEFKEYFNSIDGTLDNASISEIGLVTGLDCFYDRTNSKLIVIEDLNPEDEGFTSKELESEVLDAELFAHLTFDPYPVSRENAVIDFGYRIYS